MTFDSPADYPNLSLSSNNEENKVQTFICRKCNKVFRTRQALGGHTRKKHPKTSVKYIRKLFRGKNPLKKRFVLKTKQSLVEGDVRNVIERFFKTTNL